MNCRLLAGLLASGLMLLGFAIPSASAIWGDMPPDYYQVHNSTSMEDLANRSDFHMVAYAGACTAVLIAPEYAIGPGHCTMSKVYIMQPDGTRKDYNITSTLSEPTSFFALYKIENTGLPGYRIYRGDYRSLVGRDVYVASHGCTSGFCDCATNLNGGILRKGMNNIRSTGPGTPTWPSTATLGIQSCNPSSEWVGICFWDSGGGVFVMENNEMLLMGTIHGTSSTSGYMKEMAATSMEGFVDLIDSYINPTGTCKDNVDCGDRNPCTNDICNAGACSHANNSEPCDDGDICTDDFCSAGNCSVHNYNTASCSDGNTCTVNDRCSNGVCSGTTNCSAYDFPGCNHGDSNPMTWDYLSGVTYASTCSYYSCLKYSFRNNQLNSMTHACDKARCGAECAAAGECPVEKCDENNRFLSGPAQCSGCECVYSSSQCIIGRCGAECSQVSDCPAYICDGTTLYSASSCDLCDCRCSYSNPRCAAGKCGAQCETDADCAELLSTPSPLSENPVIAFFEWISSGISQMLGWITGKVIEPACADADVNSDGTVDSLDVYMVNAAANRYDIDGDGDVDGDDKAQMNRRLNSMTVQYPDENFDMNFDGDVDGDDKAQMNRRLNSMTDTRCNAGNGWCNRTDVNQDMAVNDTDVQKASSMIPYCGPAPPAPACVGCMCV